jgi:DNA recombination protein RmuC
LKTVLTHVQTRGPWGEIALGNLLEQILAPEQYEKNVVTRKGSRDPVEFAIKLPGKEDRFVYLPIDAKFPKEDYERLVMSQEAGDVVGVEDAGRALETRIKAEAKKIHEKYIDPPRTTDFGILFLPIEGLYAEVLRRVGLFEFIQREYKITLAGPTTLAAMLNSLQMGFRTLAVEKRASDVWILLGSVKKEFGKFGEILDKTHTKLQQASHEIENAARKTRTIESRLKKVETLSPDSEELSLSAVSDDASQEEDG